MKVIYPGPHEAVQLPDGTVCPKDKPVNVSDAVGASLIAQGFSEPKKNEGK